MPAAEPAPVTTRSSSTYSTSGLTFASGNASDSSSVCRQCVVHSRPSSRPASPRTKEAVQCAKTMRTALVGLAGQRHDRRVGRLELAVR